MTQAKSAFAWMFIGLVFIAGTVFGAELVSKDRTAYIFLLFPGIIVLVAGMIGFTDVFTEG